MWKAFTCLKSELVNHWLPHFEMKSGEDLDDAIERVRTHAWAFRHNRNVKKNNRKARLEGREEEEEKVYTDAPPGSTTNIPLKLPVVKKHYDHPFLKVNLCAADDEDDSEKEEDGRFQGIVSSLTKRKQQRKEHCTYDKKARGDDTDKKLYLQAQAANRHLAILESKNMIDFLHLVKDSDILDQNEMKGMFLTAKKRIFGEEKFEPNLVTETTPSTSGVSHDDSGDDDDVIYS